jgi:hypothetical protein
MLMFLLGSLVTVALGIVANLLTPGVKPLWATGISWARHGMEAQTRQKLKVLRVELDQLNRFKASDRDLYLYLFRWVLGIIALLVAAIVCAFVSMADTITSEDRLQLVRVSLFLLLVSLISSVVILRYCSDYTVAGTEKKIATLEATIAKLKATLPESRAN